MAPMEQQHWLKSLGSYQKPLGTLFGVTVGNRLVVLDTIKGLLRSSNSLHLSTPG